MTSMISDTSPENRPPVLLGAAGRLGQMLCAHWPGSCPPLRQSTRPHDDFVVFDLILEPEKAAEAMAGQGAVLCFAGVTPARATVTDEVLSRNSDLALAALRAAHAAGAGRVFVTSSAAVYGAQGGLLSEATAAQPVAPYGQAKLEMEHRVLAEARALGHPVTVLRIGNVAGADAILGGWHADMQIDQLADGTTPRRSYIGPQDLAQVVHALSQQKDLPACLNIAAPGAVEMGALLDAAGLAWRPRRASAQVIADVTLDVSVMQRHAPLPAEAGQAARLIAQWRAFGQTC